MNDIERGTVEHWAILYRSKTGLEINLNSLRKRRKIANVGEWFPPSKYLLTEEEFYTAMNTPLPLCNSVGTDWPRVRLANA